MKSVMKPALCGLSILFLGLAGCGDIGAELAKSDREIFQESCDDLGIARGTPGFDQCILQQQELKERRDQASQDRIRAQEAADQRKKEAKKERKALKKELRELEEF